MNDFLLSLCIRYPSRSVLSIVGLVCPPLSGILLERAFPYVGLTDFAFQDVYISLPSAPSPLGIEHL